MKDFSFQGKVFQGTRLPGGKSGILTWWGDVPQAEITFSPESEDRKESSSGRRLTSASLDKGTTGTIALTLNYFSGANAAIGLYGLEAVIAPGAATAELLPEDIAVGSYIALDNGRISSLEIEDSAGVPATLVQGVNYKIDSAGGGLIQFLDLGAFVQPFSATYDYGAAVEVAMFTQSPIERYLLLDGINTLDGSRIHARLFRTKFDPFSSIPLINESFGQLQLSGKILYDEEAVLADGDSGFGKMRILEAV